jgi:hypothetical protein
MHYRILFFNLPMILTRIQEFLNDSYLLFLQCLHTHARQIGMLIAHKHKLKEYQRDSSNIVSLSEFTQNKHAHKDIILFLSSIIVSFLS